MNFFKTFLAALSAIAVVIFLLLLLFVGIIGSALSSSEKVVLVKDNSVLKISLEGQIVENAPASSDDLDLDFAEFAPFPLASSSNKLGLFQLVENIKKAKDDDRIRGIYLTISPSMAAGQVTLRNIHDALLDFKSSGKFIHSYSEIYTEGGLYLASAADQIYMPKSGIAEFNGFASSPMYYKGLFEKLDIKPQIFKVGTFKSAIEPYITDKMSDSARKQVEVFLGVLWDEYSEDFAEARGMSKEEVNKVAENFVFGDGEKAKAAGLVDELMYEEQVLNKLREELDLEESQKIKFITMKKYLKTPSLNRSTAKDKIAIIFADGEIRSGKNSDGVVGSESIVKALRKAREDDNVKAVVLRVNSPGGSALASDMMADEVKLTSDVKPIVCSMGNVAASGGYYIAAPCDKIFAEKNTITGSIGIFGMFFTTNEMFEKNLGLTFDQVETHSGSNFGNPNYELSKGEQMLLQRNVEKGYGSFLEVVRSGRSAFFADSAAVDKVGQGRVWAGRDAKGINLIDEYGSLQDAIAYAAEVAGLEGDGYRKQLLPRQKSSMEQLMEAFGQAQVKNIPMYEEMKQLERLKNMANRPGVYTLMPFSIEVN